MCPLLGRARVTVLVSAACLFSYSPCQADEELYRMVASSTAAVYKNEGPYGGAGTGFLIDAQERLVVTARHVVESVHGGVIPVVFIMFAQSKDGAVITDAAHYRKNWRALAVKGQVVYESVRRDMAVIQVEKIPEGIKALQLAAHKARPGQTVHLVGNSMDRFGALFSYCQGHVRNAFYWEEMGASVVATQAPANKGDSGGPMVDNAGKVVGFAAMSTTGDPLPKTSSFHETQVTEFSICVTEIRAGLQDMRNQRLAKANNSALSQEMLAIQGEAQLAAQPAIMEKDVLYRIVVKAEGFTPQIRIDNILVPSAVPAPGNNELHHLFTPMETKEYRIQVSNVPGRAIGKGPFRYALSVDKVAFEPATVFKEPELKLNEHVRKFHAGKVYEISVKGKGFQPDVQIADDNKAVLAKLSFGKPVNTGSAQWLFEAVGLTTAEYDITLKFVAPKTKEYRILIAVSRFSQQSSGKLNYTVRIAERKVELSVSGELTAKDSHYPQAGPFKAHEIKLEAGKTYQIDLITAAFDSCLVLEDSASTVVARGVDTEGLSGSLTFRPTKTETYRVVATSYQFNARGPYSLIVAENPCARAAVPVKENR